MLELVSVHIPKAGGATLANVLRRKYGQRLRLIYPPPEEPVFARGRLAVTRTLRNWRPAPRAVHGHFPASRFANSGAPLITFVRDPLMMRISLWHYARREYARRGLVANQDWRNAIDLELPEFLELPSPTLTQFLDVPIERFAFIGLVERYKEDMLRLCSLLNTPYTPEHANKNPAGSDYEIEPQLQKQYELANARETALYDEIKNLSLHIGARTGTLL